MTVKAFEIRVIGEIPSNELIEFENLTSVVEPTSTTLRGTVIDQAELQRVLQRIHGLGLELLDVRRVTDGTAEHSPTAPSPS